MRLFVAVQVPKELREKIAGLGREIEGDGIIPVKQQNMHITLKFIGEVQEKQLEDIKERLSKIKFGGFRCAIKGVGVFPSENYIRVVWAGIESGGALESLAKEVISGLKGHGDDDRFTAHLTIARVKKKTDLGEFLEKHKEEDFGSFEVTHFELIESRLGGPKGPEYHTVAGFEAEN
jgi:2'-5' RNA ligase